MVDLILAHIFASVLQLLVPVRLTELCFLTTGAKFTPINIEIGTCRDTEIRFEHFASRRTIANVTNTA